MSAALLDGVSRRAATTQTRSLRARTHAIILSAACSIAMVQVATAAAADVAVGISNQTFDYTVPLDPHSPWPKFRRNAQQNGRSTVRPTDSGRPPWNFHTGKGVFSSPVIDGDGTTYVGSADRTFYAIDRDGSLKWKFSTGEIIDSSALLDNEGRVIFGSGDGHLYALNRATGDVLWTFRADDPAVNAAFINWFEGNVAIGADGTLYAPNDNFCTYAVRRATGERVWCAKAYDQTWSLPALDAASGRLFLGNNFAFLYNTVALDAASGHAIWRATTNGTVAASPVLTNVGGSGMMVVGGFDGYLRAYDPARGRERWRFGARDHIYASPAEMADGTIIQPSADGTIYALNPANGTLRWAFDTREPIRSSPAIDGADNIYVGSGEGRLFVLNPDGSLRWSIRLIDDERDDLNASPALGADAIVIGGEDGGIFSVPYDYCLRPGPEDARCTGGGKALLPDGVFLQYTTPFGRLLPEAPNDIEANQPLTFSLLARHHGNTELALIDSASVRTTLAPARAVHVDVSGDRKFLTIVPSSPYAGAAGGDVTVHVQGNYLVNFERSGLRFTGGNVGGSFDETYHFRVRPHSGGGWSLPVPYAPGDRSGLWELYRFAAPLPTILPSYNQIGFDSIHYLIGLVEGDATHAVGWAIGGRPRADNHGEVDPASRVRFPLDIQYDTGLLTMTNEAGFTIEFNGFPLPFEFFRVATRVDERGAALSSPAVNTRTTCGKIDFYGEFLQALGYCNPTTDLLNVVGGAELRPVGSGVQTAPEGIGRVTFSASSSGVTATFSDSQLRVREHNIGLLLIDPASGRPFPLSYTRATTHAATPEGLIASTTLGITPGAVRGAVRVYAMVDTYPAALGTVTLPAFVPWHTRVADALGTTWNAARNFCVRLGRHVALYIFRLLG